MYARPTNVVSVFRGEVVDDDYPAQDNDDNTGPPVLTGVLIAIQEGPVNSGQPSDDDVTDERLYDAKVRSNLDIRKGDRLYDAKTDLAYLVESVEPRTSPFHKADTALTLSRVL